MAWFIMEPIRECGINARNKLVEHRMDLMSHRDWEPCLLLGLKLKKG